MIFGHFDLTYFCRAADYRSSRPQASDVVDGVHVEVDEGDDEARHVPHSGLHDVHWEVFLVFCSDARNLQVFNVSYFSWLPERLTGQVGRVVVSKEELCK